MTPKYEFLKSAPEKSEKRISVLGNFAFFKFALLKLEFSIFENRKSAFSKSAFEKSTFCRVENLNDASFKFILLKS